MPKKKIIRIRKKNKRTTKDTSVKQTTGQNIHVYVNSGNTRTTATPKPSLYRKEKEDIMNTLLNQEVKKVIPRIQLASTLPPAEAGYNFYKTLADNRDKEFNDKVKKETERLEELYKRLNKEGNYRVSDREGLMSNTLNSNDDMGDIEYRRVLDFTQGGEGGGEQDLTPGTRVLNDFKNMKDFMKEHYLYVPKLPKDIADIKNGETKRRRIVKYIDEMKSERDIQAKYFETKRLFEQRDRLQPSRGGGLSEEYDDVFNQTPLGGDARAGGGGDVSASRLGRLF